MGQVADSINTGALAPGTTAPRTPLLAGRLPRAGEPTPEDAANTPTHPDFEGTRSGSEAPVTTESVSADDGAVKGPADNRDQVEVHDNLQGDGFDVDSATVDELRNRAAELDVAGRSDMNKAELQEAVRAAQA